MLVVFHSDWGVDGRGFYMSWKAIDNGGIPPNPTNVPTIAPGNIEYSSLNYCDCDINNRIIKYEHKNVLCVVKNAHKNMMSLSHVCMIFTLYYLKYTRGCGEVRDFNTFHSFIFNFYHPVKGRSIKLLFFAVSC